jgi:hypothetical protein
VTWLGSVDGLSIYRCSLRPRPPLRLRTNIEHLSFGTSGFDTQRGSSWFLAPKSQTAHSVDELHLAQLNPNFLYCPRTP